MTPETDSIQKDFQLAEEDFLTIQLGGFTEEERRQYQILTEKMKEHTIEYLIRALSII